MKPAPEIPHGGRTRHASRYHRAAPVRVATGRPSIPTRVSNVSTLPVCRTCLLTPYAPLGPDRCGGRQSDHATGSTQPPRSARAATLIVATVTVAIAALLGAPSASAQLLGDGDQLRLSYGPWSYHFSRSDEHVRFNHLVGVDLLSRRWTVFGAARSQVGFAAFDNSFGQFSQYLYAGQEWDWTRIGSADVVLGLTAGVLHGYRDQYRDKIPFNRYGVAPAIIPSIGLRWGRFAVTANVLGANGFLFAASWIFDLQLAETMAVPIRPAVPPHR